MSKLQTAEFFNAIIDGIWAEEFSEEAFERMMVFITQFGSRGAAYSAICLRKGSTVIDGRLFFNYTDILDIVRLKDQIHLNLGVK